MTSPSPASESSVFSRHRHTLLIHGEPEGYVTLDEYLQILDSPYAATEGLEAIDLLEGDFHPDCHRNIDKTPISPLDDVARPSGVTKADSPEPTRNRAVAASSPNRSDAQQSVDDLEQYISASETARLLGWKTSTLRKYRGRNQGPAGYIKTGKTRGYYLLREVIAFQQKLQLQGVKR